jgi:hypothetical protein
MFHTSGDVIRVRPQDTLFQLQELRKERGLQAAEFCEIGSAEILCIKRLRLCEKMAEHD